MKRIALAAMAFVLGVLILGAVPGGTGTDQSSRPAPAKAFGQFAGKSAAGLLERTAGDHIIGFGAQAIVVGSRDHALRLEFVGSLGASPECSESGSPAALKAPALGTVIYRNLWPGITLTYQGEKNGMAKSVWTVAPGAPLESIRVRANVPLRADRLGNLVYAFSSGRMTESKPVAWQEIEGKRVPVDVSYRLTGEREFGFEAAACDSRYPLVIDPILSWNTFLGGAGDDSANAIWLDLSGNIYIVGYSNATWGTPIRAYAGNNYDAFVAKLSPNGTLLWNTFLGGQMNDYGYAIGLDASGNIYVSGQSNMTWESPIRAFSTSPDAFVAKLNSSGTLVWNTFLGGAGSDYNDSMAVDPGGNCYAVGASNASWGTPVNPFNAIPAGYNDWSIAKVDNNGYLQWNTFLGGTASDIAFGVALDLSGGVYVAGQSRASWGTPISAYTGGADIAVARINASDAALQWNTFFGQAGEDYAYGISVSPEGILLVAGQSDATWGTPINSYAGGVSDGFIMALEFTGAFLGHTFIGGPGMDGCTSVSGNRAGQIYIGGYSTATWGRPDKPYGGGSSDGFVVRLGATGNFQALTFLGGGGSDGANALAVGKNRDFYVAGSSDATWGRPIRAYSSGGDGFVFKSTFIPDALDRHAVGDFDGDGIDEAAVDFGSIGIWMYNAGAWSQISPEDPDNLVALNIDGDADDEIAADMGDGGLWLWDGGTLSQLSAVDAQGLAAGDVDGDGADELLGDFGSIGLWLYDGGAWSQISGVDPDYIAVADLDGVGGKEIIGDFGATGMWVRSAGTWTQLSGVNPDFFTCGNTDGAGGQEIVGDFATTGMWLNNSGVWTQLSGVDANYMITADMDGNGQAEIIGDFGTVGLWVWNSGTWTILSSVREEYMIAANVDADPAKEMFVDFGSLGLWEYDGGAWIQLSGVNPEYMMSGDFDGDSQAELMVDFGSLGLWLWNGGSWGKISNGSPD
jgi:hypothetical protein